MFSVRGRSRSLLCSAVFALGAGCGLGTAGWAWLDAAPASAQPLIAVAHLDNPHAASNDQVNGKGNAPGSTHGNGSSHAKGKDSSRGQGNGNNQSRAQTSHHGQFRSHGHSAQATGPKEVTTPTTVAIPLKPQAAVPTKARPSTPAPTAPAPVRPPTPIDALGSVAVRLIGAAAVHLATNQPGGPVPSPATTALHAFVPGGWLPGVDFYRRELGLLNGSFSSTTFQVARKLKLPIALLVGATLFLLIQSLVDRRDPKVAHAPQHAQDDSLDFA
jgi:hypothetical protein